MQKQDLSVFDSIPPSQSSSTSQLQGTCGNDAEAGSGTSWPQVINKENVNVSVKNMVQNKKCQHIQNKEN